MGSSRRRGFLVIEEQEPIAAVLARAAPYKEVVVIALARPGAGERWVVDSDRARKTARARLEPVLALLRERGIGAIGAVSDDDADTARADAEALYAA